GPAGGGMGLTWLGNFASMRPLSVFQTSRAAAARLVPFRRHIKRKSANGCRASEGWRVLRERNEAFQEAMREGRHPLGDPQARALREAEREAEEEGARGQEAGAQEDAQGWFLDVIEGAARRRSQGCDAREGCAEDQRHPHAEERHQVPRDRG